MDGEGIKLKCKNCGYEWHYNGKKKVMATCPDCVHKVKIENSKAE